MYMDEYAVYMNVYVHLPPKTMETMDLASMRTRKMLSLEEEECHNTKSYFESFVSVIDRLIIR